jgi:hypothetical protein
MMPLHSTWFSPGRGDARQRHVLALDAVEVALDGGGHVEVVEADIGRGIDELDGVVSNLEQGPGRGAAVEHDVIVAVATQEGGKVVAGVGIEDGVAVGRLAGEVAARGRRHAAGEHAGAEDQRNLGIERCALLFDQVVEQPHVGAASAEEVLQHFDRQILLQRLALFQVDEQDCALRVVLRRVMHARDESLQLFPDSHLLLLRFVASGRPCFTGFVLRRPSAP